jgi:2-amino-4-hydroxy-6-hydroxymethyldihydropteridine diphosphokinase
MSHLVYIALGSNLDEPLQQVTRALTELTSIPELTLIKASPFYLNKPIGPQDQPDFVNGVALFHCNLSAHELLALLQTVEQQHQRLKSRRWGPRTLDLDILLYDQEAITTPQLIIPHPELKKRAFVVFPLHDIEPTLVLPDGTRLSDLTLTLDRSTLSLLTPLDRR